MKKKIYFSISAILQILMALYIIANANSIVQEQIETISEVYSVFPMDFQERMLSILSKSGVPTLIFEKSIVVILNLVILKVAISDNVLKKKGLFIAFSVICFFLAGSTLGVLLALINFIVLLCLKRKNPEDFPVKEKKEIPHLEYEKPTKREMILSIIFVCTYFLMIFLDEIIGLFALIFTGKPIDEIPLEIAIIINVVFYIILFVLGIITFKDRLKRDIKLFKENRKAYIRFLLPRVGIMYLVFIVVAMTSTILSGQAVSANQEMLESMPMWFVIPAAVIYAPVVEELIFRGTFRRFIKNKVAFVIVSALVFGLLHTIGEDTIFKVFVEGMPYSVLGGFLAYIYAKSDNLCNNILVHAFQNTLAMIAMNVLLYVM